MWSEGVKPVTLTLTLLLWFEKVVLQAEGWRRAACEQPAGKRQLCGQEAGAAGRR